MYIVLYSVYVCVAFWELAVTRFKCHVVLYVLCSCVILGLSVCPTSLNTFHNLWSQMWFLLCMLKLSVVAVVMVSVIACHCRDKGNNTGEDKDGVQQVCHFNKGKQQCIYIQCRVLSIMTL